MSEEKDLKQAKTVFNSLCQMLEENDWHYEKHEDDLTIVCGAKGEDLPMELIVQVDMKRQIIALMSQMPFTVPENRRSALAVAVSVANYGMVDGNFDYDYLSGRIIFRMTSSYRESLIGKKLLMYMLMCACFTIDKYNDKFLSVAKTDMSLDEILELIK